MTRKDFERLARALKAVVTHDHTWVMTVANIAHELKLENERFKHVVFMKACGCTQDDLEVAAAMYELLGA